MLEEAARRYLDLLRRLGNGKASWGLLTKAQQGKLNEAAGLWCLAADPGHAMAQCNLGCRFNYGRGVTRNLGGAVRWFRQAAGK